MKRVHTIARLSLLPLFLPLAACGGDGSNGVGGIVSTPPPPTYTKLADVTGNQTFQSAGVSSKPYYGTPYSYSSEKYGNGAVIAYSAANDSYTLTAADGSTDTLSSSTGLPPPIQPTPPPNTVIIYGLHGAISITKPTVGGIALSYMAVGGWEYTLTGQSFQYNFVYGVPTIASDMPKNGTANYQTSLSGSVYTGGGSPYSLQPQSTATFSANFAEGTVATTLNLVATPFTGQSPTNYGSFSGTGTIASGGPGFSGTLASAPSNPTSATGEFAGAFFGPQATEMGYAWYLTGGVTAQGIVVGKK